jgi:quercetin dioxygenase-like cupin family protein
MQIVHGRPEGAASDQRGATFTGVVHADPVLPSTDGVTINNVFFTPGAHTYWHSHERGQILVVTAGAGWVCSRGSEPQSLKAGDVVWVPPGEQHWHGGRADSWLLHTAISLGVTNWLEEVPEDLVAALADKR